jgi:hypothetical protein
VRVLSVSAKHSVAQCECVCVVAAVNGVQSDHHYTKTAKDTVTAVLTAGMDTDCGGFMNNNTLMPLLEDPAIEKLVDTAL